MTNPLDFVRKTADAYTGLSTDDLDELFGDVDEEVRRTAEIN